MFYFCYFSVSLYFSLMGWFFFQWSSFLNKAFHFIEEFFPVMVHSWCKLLVLSWKKRSSHAWGWGDMELEWHATHAFVSHNFSPIIQYRGPICSVNALGSLWRKFLSLFPVVDVILLLYMFHNEHWWYKFLSNVLWKSAQVWSDGGFYKIDET